MGSRHIDLSDGGSHRYRFVHQGRLDDRDADAAADVRCGPWNGVVEGGFGHAEHSGVNVDGVLGIEKGILRLDGLAVCHHLHVVPGVDINFLKARPLEKVVPADEGEARHVVVDVVDQHVDVGCEGAFDAVVGEKAAYFFLQVGLGQLLHAARDLRGQGRLYLGQDLDVGQVAQGRVKGIPDLAQVPLGREIFHVLVLLFSKLIRQLHNSPLKADGIQVGEAGEQLPRQHPLRRLDGIGQGEREAAAQGLRLF